METARESTDGQGQTDSEVDSPIRVDRGHLGEVTAHVSLARKSTTRSRHAGKASAMLGAIDRACVVTR